MSVRLDPAFPTTRSLYRIVENRDARRPDLLWRVEAFNGPAGEWRLMGCVTTRVGAEMLCDAGAIDTVHHWRAGLARAYRVDYHLEAVHTDQFRTVLTERITRHFWHTGNPDHIRGYAA